MRRFLTSAALLCIPALASGCTSDTADEAKPDEPYMMPYSFIWHADPSVDRDGPEDTFIRAYVESFYRFLDAQDEGSAFPGFKRASAFDVAGLIHGLYVSPTEWHPFWGTRDMKVISVNAVGNEYTARLCEYGDRLAAEMSPGEYGTTAIRDQYAWFNEISFQKLGKAPTSDPGGKSNRPKGDLFGDWRVTGFQWSRPFGGLTMSQSSSLCNQHRPDIPAKYYIDENLHPDPPVPSATDPGSSDSDPA